MGKSRLSRFNKNKWPQMSEEKKREPFNPNYLIVDRIIDWKDENSEEESSKEENRKGNITKDENSEEEEEEDNYEEENSTLEYSEEEYSEKEYSEEEYSEKEYSEEEEEEEENSTLEYSEKEQEKEEEEEEKKEDEEEEEIMKNKEDEEKSKGSPMEKEISKVKNRNRSAENKILIEIEKDEEKDKNKSKPNSNSNTNSKMSPESRKENKSEHEPKSDSEPDSNSEPEIEFISEKEIFAENRKFLVKWRSLPYSECTWETKQDINDDQKIITCFHKENMMKTKLKFLQERNKTRKNSTSPKTNRSSFRLWKQLKKSPTYQNGNKLRNYQVEGLNWLSFNWHQNRNGILADQMGLGKSIQTIAILQHLKDEQNIHGPFLLVVPLSTLLNWEREFKNWSDLNFVVYHGTKDNRETIRNLEFYYSNQRYPTKIKGGKYDRSHKWYNLYRFDVLITTYQMAAIDQSYISKIEWEYFVIDEGHKLKNRNSLYYRKLFELESRHTLILTGTPLQNNIAELWAILHFLEPKKFDNEENFIEEFGDLKDSSKIEELHQVLKPHLLRRLKEDVEKTILPKEETIIEVELTKFQKQFYRAVLRRNVKFLSKGIKSGRAPKLINVVIQLRKICIHPYLLEGAENFANQELKSQEEKMKALIINSGKFVLLDKLLPKLKRQGSKVLIFSQMVMVLNIIQEYLDWKHYNYERIDGSIRGNDRQQAIDRFNNPKFERFIFLLCTRAGGLGINLTSANTVIIFDSDWNPQNDIQAMDRCHRIGQTKLVQVYRLITRNTYERDMFDRASKKLGLDQAVLTNITASANQENSYVGVEESLKSYVLNKNEKQLNAKEINELLKYGAYNLFNDNNDEDSKKFCEEDIDQILEKRTTKITHDQSKKKNKKISNFSRATFISEGADTYLDVNDPNFWSKIIPEGKKRKLFKKSNKLSLYNSGNKFRRITRKYKKEWKKKQRRINKYFNHIDSDLSSDSDSDSDSDPDSETDSDSDSGSGSGSGSNSRSNSNSESESEFEQKQEEQEQETGTEEELDSVSKSESNPETEENSNEKGDDDEEEEEEESEDDDDDDDDDEDDDGKEEYAEESEYGTEEKEYETDTDTDTYTEEESDFGYDPNSYFRPKYYSSSDSDYQAQSNSNSEFESEFESESDLESYSKHQIDLNYELDIKPKKTKNIGEFWYKSEGNRLIKDGLLLFGCGNRLHYIQEKAKIKRKNIQEIKIFILTFLKLLISKSSSYRLMNSYPLLLMSIYEKIYNEFKKSDDTIKKIPILNQFKEEFEKMTILLKEEQEELYLKKKNLKEK